MTCTHGNLSVNPCPYCEIESLQAKVEALKQEVKDSEGRCRSREQVVDHLDDKVEVLEEDIRIANENLEKAEQWQDKMTDVYPIVANRITRILRGEKG